MGMANRERDICARTFAFATRIVTLCRHLYKQPGSDYILTRQLMRAGTSIGANVEEAQAGQSDADFVAKYSIALKEARETRYWLRLIAAMGDIPSNRIEPLIVESEELARIIAAIIISARKRHR